MSRLRERNAGAIQDFLDGALEVLHPGSPDPDQHAGDKSKGESRVLLKEAQLKRIDAEGLAGEHESHKLLMRLMVSPDSWLARHLPTEHSALTTFVLGAPEGYQKLLGLEKLAAEGEPLAAAPAEYCRRGVEVVLGVLDEMGHELAVKRLPAYDSKKAAVVDKRHEDVRDAYDRELKRTGSVSTAIEKAATSHSYEYHTVRKMTADKRAS